MLPEHYARVMKVASTLGVNACTITGGEPTLRSDLNEIISGLREFSKNITMVSNGYKLHRHLEAIKLLDELHVSYHSMSSKEWERITRITDGPKKVKENLLSVREIAPNIKIRLNVVAEEQNSSHEEIEKYIRLAIMLDAEITVFRESCSSIMKELGATIKNTSVSEVWNLSKFGAVIVEESERRKTYAIKNVIINIQQTSSEKSSWESCWFSPLGHSFVDTRQKSNLVDFLNYCVSDDEEKIKEGLLSLFEEANIMKSIELKKDSSDHLYDAYRKNLECRDANLNTSNPVTVQSLPLWQK
jgi:wyosine [tRNA(Phe)-imidazoG37] synthetase (radical SAM superfamily)